MKKRNINVKRMTIQNEPHVKGQFAATYPSMGFTQSPVITMTDDEVRVITCGDPSCGSISVAVIDPTDEVAYTAITVEEGVSGPTPTTTRRARPRALPRSPCAPTPWSAGRTRSLMGAAALVATRLWSLAWRDRRRKMRCTIPAWTILQMARNGSISWPCFCTAACWQHRGAQSRCCGCYGDTGA